MKRLLKAAEWLPGGGALSGWLGKDDQKDDDQKDQDDDEPSQGAKGAPHENLKIGCQIPGGFEVGDVVYPRLNWIDESDSTRRVAYNERGVVRGPSDSSDKSRVNVLFSGETSLNMAPIQIARTKLIATSELGELKWSRAYQRVYGIKGDVGYSWHVQSWESGYPVAYIKALPNATQQQLQGTGIQTKPPSVWTVQSQLEDSERQRDELQKRLDESEASAASYKSRWTNAVTSKTKIKQQRDGLQKRLNEAERKTAEAFDLATELQVIHEKQFESSKLEWQQKEKKLQAIHERKTALKLTGYKQALDHERKLTKKYLGDLTKAESKLTQSQQALDELRERTDWYADMNTPNDLETLRRSALVSKRNQLSEKQVEINMRILELNQAIEDQTPNDILCPISLEVLEDPVIAADGFSYERRSIEQWFQGGPRGNNNRYISPKTSLPLDHRNLITNYALRGVIQELTGGS